MIRGGRLALLAAALATVAELLSPGPAPACDRKVYEIVYYFPDLVGKDRAKIVGYYQAYLDAQVAPVLGVPVRVRYFAQLDDLVAFVAECRRQGLWPFQANLHGEVALQYRNRWGLEAFGAAVEKSTQLTTHRISVLVRSDSNIHALEDLHGRRAIAPSYWGQDVERFERMVLDGRLRLSELGELVPTPSSLSAATGIYFKEADAAFVSDHVFRVLKESSPQVWRSLRAIFASHPIPMAIAAFFPGSSERLRATQIAETLRLQDTEEGRRWADYEMGSHVQRARWADLFTPAELAAARDFEVAAGWRQEPAP